jgi:hypothetical protein
VRSSRFALSVAPDRQLQLQGDQGGMTGYEKSPPYGGPKAGRWTMAAWLIALIAGAATIYLLFTS